VVVVERNSWMVKVEGHEFFLKKLEQRLSNNGFEIKRKISAPPYPLDFVAAKSSWEVSKFGKMTRFILAATMGSVDSKTVQDFSSRSTKYALDNRGSMLPRGMGGSLLSVPVVISEDFEQSLKKWMIETLAEKHWAAFEFPVLISLKDQQLYYCKKTPVWGAAYYKGFREFVEEYLSPSAVGAVLAQPYDARPQQDIITNKKFCANCGTPISSGDKFCGSCGGKV